MLFAILVCLSGFKQRISSHRPATKVEAKPLLHIYLHKTEYTTFTNDRQYTVNKENQRYIFAATDSIGVKFIFDFLNTFSKFSIFFVSNPTKTLPTSAPTPL